MAGRTHAPVFEPCAVDALPAGLLVRVARDGHGGAAGRAAGGNGDYAFVYLHLRVSQGRSGATLKRVGDALLLATKSHFQPVFSQRYIGVTLQIDEGAEVFDARHSNLHPLFRND